MKKKRKTEPIVVLCFLPQPDRSNQSATQYKNRHSLSVFAHPYSHSVFSELPSTEKKEREGREKNLHSDRSQHNELIE